MKKRNNRFLAGTLAETGDVEKARAAVYTRTCEIICSFRIEGNQEKLFG